MFTRFLEGEDLAESIRKQAEINGIRAGYFIVIGSVNQAALGYYKDGKYETMLIEGPLEIASCTGNIVVDENDKITVHAHLVVSNAKSEAYGGHLMKGSKIGATAESVMTEAQGVEIQKAYDEKTKLKLWRLG